VAIIYLQILTVWFVEDKRNVFTARYELNF